MNNFTGWKKILGVDCYLENGRIIRAMYDGRACYIYKARNTGDFDRVEPSESNFRAGDFRIM